MWIKQGYRCRMVVGFIFGYRGKIYWSDMLDTDISGLGLVSLCYYNRDNGGEGTLGTRKITFSDGWPVLGEHILA